MEILGYDHVGLRVVDRSVSLGFFGSLGFIVDPNHSNERVAEIVNRAGTRMNLIFNGEPTDGGRNVLMDVPERSPGYTHAAFVVPDLADVLAWARARGVEITEGPVNWGRRLTCFLRDPDRNVLEFNQLLDSGR